MSTKIDPVEEVLPISRLLALGLQHVLVMYAGAIVVPLVVGRALKLPSLSPSKLGYRCSSEVTTRSVCALWSKPP